MTQRRLFYEYTQEMFAERERKRKRGKVENSIYQRLKEAIRSTQIRPSELGERIDGSMHGEKKRISNLFASIYSKLKEATMKTYFNSHVQ